VPKSLGHLFQARVLLSSPVKAGKLPLQEKGAEGERIGKLVASDYDFSEWDYTSLRKQRCGIEVSEEGMELSGEVKFQFEVDKRREKIVP